MPDATPAVAAKPSTTSTVVSAFRRLMELALMLVAALAALFFYKSAEEKERERERLEKARRVSALIGLTHYVGPNLRLTSKQKFRFSVMSLN